RIGSGTRREASRSNRQTTSRYFGPRIEPNLYHVLSGRGGSPTGSRPFLSLTPAKKGKTDFSHPSKSLMGSSLVREEETMHWEENIDSLCNTLGERQVVCNVADGCKDQEMVCEGGLKGGEHEVKGAR
ncbi:unnamed protein product, partial [Choristocarpus tenellus]